MTVRELIKQLMAIDNKNQDIEIIADNKFYEVQSINEEMPVRFYTEESNL